MMEHYFEETIRNDPVTLNINDDEYVLDSYLSAINFSHIYLYIESIGCPYMTFTNVYFNLVEMKKEK